MCKSEKGLRISFRKNYSLYLDQKLVSQASISVLWAKYFGIFRPYDGKLALESAKLLF